MWLERFGFLGGSYSPNTKTVQEFGLLGTTHYLAPNNSKRYNLDHGPKMALYDDWNEEEVKGHARALEDKLRDMHRRFDQLAEEEGHLREMEGWLFSEKSKLQNKVNKLEEENQQLKKQLKQVNPDNPHSSTSLTQSNSTTDIGHIPGGTVPPSQVTNHSSPQSQAPPSNHSPSPQGSTIPLGPAPMPRSNQRAQCWAGSECVFWKAHRCMFGHPAPYSPSPHPTAPLAPTPISAAPADPQLTTILGSLVTLMTANLNQQKMSLQPQLVPTFQSGCSSYAPFQSGPVYQPPFQPFGYSPSSYQIPPPFPYMPTPQSSTFNGPPLAPRQGPGPGHGIGPRQSAAQVGPVVG